MEKDRRKNNKCIGVTMIMLSLFVMLSCGKKYDYIGDYQGGLALVHSVKTNKYGAIDNKKKEVIPCIYDTILLSNNSPIVMLNGKYGVVSISGTEKIPCLYDNISFDGKFYIVQLDNKYGIFSISGAEKIPCRYDSISFDGKYFIVQLDNKYGVFSESKEIIKTKYDAFSFSENKIIAELDGEIYNFDGYGNFLPDMLYIDVYRKDNGEYLTYAEVMVHNIFGGLEEQTVYFIDAISKERLKYKEIIIDGNTVVETTSVYSMFDEEPPKARFRFKDGGRKDWKIDRGRQYQYTLKNGILKIKEYADYDE